MKRVLLAVGEENMSSILKKHLVDHGFDVVDQEVLHRNYLQEAIEYEKPDILIIHDQYLQSERSAVQEREQEMLRMLDQWRLKYNDSLRIVYLCERDKTDPFLGSLVARNVLDIFYQRTIPTQIFIKQLLQPAQYTNVARLQIVDLNLSEIQVEEDGEPESVESQPMEKQVNQEEEKMALPPKQKPPIARLEKLKKQKNGLSKGLHIHVHKPSKVEIQKVGIERKIIVVISPYERTGSTFISHQLAYQIAKQQIGVTYFENPFRRPYSYDRFGGHLEVPDYRSLYACDLNDDNEFQEKQRWNVQDVQIQALNPIFEMPYDEPDLSIEHFLRLFLSFGDTPVLIIDIGADQHRKIYDELINIATDILIVMDSDISNIEWFEQNQISADFNWIYRLLSDERTLYVANQFVKEAKDIILSPRYVTVPVFNKEWIYQSQVKGCISWGGREAIKAQDEVFWRLTAEIFPKSYLTNKKASPFIQHLIPKINFKSH